MRPNRSHAAAGRTIAVRRAAFLLLSGLLLAAMPGTQSLAQTTAPIRPPAAGPYADFIAEAAHRFDVPEIWIRAVMRIESGDHVHAISPKGAMGLMQIMPATWAALSARFGLGNDPYDPRDNIFAGAAYLREMHDRYGSPGFLAAYNAGPGRYEEYQANGRPLPAETVAYVATLAPIIGNGPTPSVTVAVADPTAWARAPLFIVQAESTSHADLRQKDGFSTPPSSSAAAHDFAPAEPRTGGLFVMRTASMELR